MRKTALWLALALWAFTTQGAWAQEFGIYLNFKGKMLCFASFLMGLGTIRIKDSDAPPGLDKESTGGSLVDRLKDRLRQMGVSLRETFSCAHADADLELDFVILSIQRGAVTEGYAIFGRLVVSCSRSTHLRLCGDRLPPYSSQVL